MSILKQLAYFGLTLVGTSVGVVTMFAFIGLLYRFNPFASQEEESNRSNRNRIKLWIGIGCVAFLISFGANSWWLALIFGGVLGSSIVVMLLIISYTPAADNFEKWIQK